jgi:uncharacterized circularly permuted ATP-grasp superfamily protein
MRSDTREAIDHYHALIADDLPGAEEQLDWLTEAQHDGHVLFGGRAMANSLRPTFLTERAYAEVQDTVYLVRQAILAIASTFFNERSVLTEDLGMKPWEIDLAALPTNVVRLSATARLDAFLTGDSFKFVEFNGETPAGLAYIHALGQIYRQLPVFQRFEATYPTRFVSPLEHAVHAFLRIYHEEFGGRVEQPAFAIVDRLGDVPTNDEFRLVKAYLERLGHPCEIVDPRELDLHDGQVVANGRPIDILYRRLLMNEYHEIRDDCPAFLEGYSGQKTCYLNTFRAKLVHKKAIFAFLTDERYTGVLTGPQREAIQAHVPWTRLLRPQETSFRGLDIDLVAFVRRNRDYFVIKPNDEYGGTGVTLGFAATQDAWEDAIERGLEAGHVVQEAVDIHREPFLMKTDAGWDEVPAIIDLDPYINGPLVGGCLTRTSAQNLANVTAGGGTLPMFILRNTFARSS